MKSRCVYTNFFEFFPVDGDDLIDESYRIRYAVYCEEKAFLDSRSYPDGRETDQYDARAVHLLGRHRRLGTAAGTVRLVLSSELGFPLRRYCTLHPSFSFLSEPASPQSAHFAEISRLAVSKQFRHRIGDDPMYGGAARRRHWDDPAADERQHLNPDVAGPEIVAGLYKCIYQESKRRGLTHWIMAMERSLYLMCRRMGLLFLAIGPTSDYFGPVAPYAAAVSDIEYALSVRHPAVFSYWMAGLERDYWPDLRPVALAG
jgi:N-acyl amino acid synthase of PEP-CTERM/exosortase system